MRNRFFILPVLLFCNFSIPVSTIKNPVSNEALLKNKLDNRSKNNASSNIVYEKLSASDDYALEKDTFSLKDALLKKGIRFGTYLSAADITQRAPRPSNFMEVVSKYFNFYTMSVSFATVEPKQDVFDFTIPDKIVEFAISHNAKVKGHALVLGTSLPDWVVNGNYSPDELQSILKIHVQTIVKHFKDKYPGTVTVWNVVNEAVPGGQTLKAETSFPDAGIKKNIWTSIHKPNSSDPTDYMQLAFEWAREIDPTAKLYLNENGNEYIQDPKIDRLYNVVKHLKDKGTPIDGLGFQCHLRLFTKNRYSAAALTNTMNRFADLGLETQVSEFDVQMASGIVPNTSPTVPIPITNPSSADLQEQATLYKMFLSACLNSKKCTGFTVWGAWDGGSWVNLHWKGDFQPHILDSNLNVKPTYKALIDAVKSN